MPWNIFLFFSACLLTGYKLAYFLIKFLFFFPGLYQIKAIFWFIWSQSTSHESVYRLALFSPHFTVSWIGFVDQWWPLMRLSCPWGRDADPLTACDCCPVANLTVSPVLIYRRGPCQCQSTGNWQRREPQPRLLRLQELKSIFSVELMHVHPHAARERKRGRHN